MPRPSMRATRIPAILRAATSIFARDGISAARMEDVASAAGISKATIYLYFASKDALITDILQHWFDPGAADLSRLAEGATPIRAHLRDWARSRAEEAQAQSGPGGVGFEFLALAARQPVYRGILRAYYERYHQGLIALLDQGVARGEFRPVDTAAIATTLISQFEGLNVLSMLSPDAIDLSSATEQAVARVLDSIARQP